MRKIRLTERDLITIIRRMVNEAEKKPDNATFPKPPKSRGKIGPGGGKQKMAPAPPSAPPSAPPCVGLGLNGGNLGIGCCDKCDNPNFDPANDPICAPHCGCC